MRKTLIHLLFLLIIAGCTSKKPKVIVLGFDGITFDISEEWIKDGRLPNFRKLLNEGTGGRLNSTIPFVSPVAWTSAVTGVGPGKHSIFSFVRNVTYEKGEIISHINLSEDRKAKALWNLLTESGKYSIMINIPNTSPPEKINGIMIAGEPHADTDHPQEASFNLTYPKSAGEEFPNYRMDPSGVNYNPSSPDIYLSDRFDIYRRRKDVLFRLMKEKDWDLIWVIFTITDKIQHYYWKYMDSTHVLYNKKDAEKFRDVIFKTYLAMDSLIGKTLKLIENNTTVIVMSDHGFSPIKKVINTENFLHEYLPDSIRMWIRAYDYVSPVFKVNTPPEKGKKFYDFVRIELHNALKELRDPETGSRINREVYFSEDIYSGPWIHYGPDVVTWVDSNYRYVGYKADVNKGTFIKLEDKDFNAYHERDGVIILYGNNIKNNVILEDARIVDLNPTILYLLGESLSEDLDGRILTESISDDYIKENPPRFEGFSVKHPRNRDAEEKLKSLDYL